MFPNAINLSAIKTIPPQVFWFFIGIGTLFVVYFMIQSYKNIKRARLLEDTPTTKIRSAAQGYVELNGEQQMLRNDTSFTYISHTPCTWYRYTIEFFDKKNGWRLIEHGSSSQLFMISDGTGVCIIDPQDAEISTPCVDHWQGFKRHPKKKPGSWIGRLWGTLGKYRFTEWTMHEGMPLYVIGNFHTYDKQAFKQIYPDYGSHLTDEATINLMSKKGLDNRNPFVLSGFDQKKKIRHYRMEAFLWFIAYMSLLAGIAWVFVTRFF